MSVAPPHNDGQPKVVNLRRDVCFWMVPPHDGKVRKFRCTVGRILAVGFVLASFVGFLLFIAGDYARLQLIRARILYTVRVLSHERDTLASDNSTLRTQLEGLSATTSRALALERNVKARITELESILGSSQDLGLFGSSSSGGTAHGIVESEKLAVDLEGDVEGVGGAERDCSEGDCDLGAQGEGASEGMRANIAWQRARGDGRSSVALSADDISFALLDRLDRQIEVLRALPLGIPGDGHIRSGFGPRVSPFTSSRRMHEGIDISLPAGSYIYATGDGIVGSVERTATYGLKIDLEHSSSVVTRYAHLSKVFVSEGERVCRGEAIGLVGSSGRSTGPHLHYEVIVNGRARDPMKVIEIAQRLGRLTSLDSQSHAVPQT